MASEPTKPGKTAGTNQAETKPPANTQPNETEEKTSLKSWLDALAAASKSDLDLPENKLIASPLAFEAMEDAADEIARGLGGTIRGTGPRTILVTADADLAAAGVTFLEVDQAIDALVACADALIAKPVPGGKAAFAVETLALLPQVAAALPSLLSLITPKVTVRATAVTANDLAAAAAVMAALSQGNNAPTFVHDRFRLVPAGPLHGKLRSLLDRRLALLHTKSALPDGSTAGPDIDATIKAIDEFTAAIRAAPEGGRSLLATALLGAPLHGARPAYTHVLLVKAEGGQSQQTIEDRAFFAADRVSVFTELAITVLFIEVKTSGVRASATVSGKAHAYGKVGEELIISRPGTMSQEQRRGWFGRRGQ